MSVNLMYITNRPEIALIAERAGVDIIFVDLEFIGKDDRQKGLDTVKSHHTVADVSAVSKVLTHAKLLARCNPIHEEFNGYPSTEAEIDALIGAGAEIIMLPFFQDEKQVARFVKAVDGRAKTMLLVETPEAVENIEKILNIGGIDAVHIGLNDLSLGYGMRFMFEPLANGLVDRLAATVENRGIPFGFGGVASVDGGDVPVRYILGEHYRLGSSFAILSRSFCNASKQKDLQVVDKVFREGVASLRECERDLARNLAMGNDLSENHAIVRKLVASLEGGSQ